MAKRKRRMPTLWEVPDELWERIESLLNQEDPPKPTGRKRVDRRRALDGIIFRLRTGCQWNHIPHVYGDDSTIHRYFQRWCKQGVFEKIWALIVEECDEPPDIMACSFRGFVRRTEYEGVRLLKYHDTSTNEEMRATDLSTNWLYSIESSIAC